MLSRRVLFMTRPQEQNVEAWVVLDALEYEEPFHGARLRA